MLISSRANSTLHIRRYRPRNYEAVRRLHEVALRPTGEFLANKELDADLDDIGSVYLDNAGEFLVGECGGRLIAMGALRKTSAERAEVKRMRVEPGFQGGASGERCSTPWSGGPPRLVMMKPCTWTPPPGRELAGLCTRRVGLSRWDVARCTG